MSALDKVKDWFKGTKDKGQEMAGDAMADGRSMGDKGRDRAGDASDEAKERMTGEGGTPPQT